MEQILTCIAPLIRQLLVRTNNTVTNRTLTLALERTGDILPPCHQTINEAAAGGGEVDYALSRDEPAAPLLLIHSHTMNRVDSNGREWISWGKADTNGHCLVVDGIGSCQFVGAGRDSDLDFLVVGVLGWKPGSNSGKLGSNN